MELDPTVIEKKFGIHISERHYKDPERQAQYEEFMNNRTDENGKKIKTRLLTAQMQWIKNERDCLIRMFEKNGYKIKNPGEHRPHLETDDYIEQQDQNLQDLLLKQYNELSSKIDFLEKEEQELLEKEKQLAEKEKNLNQKELDQERKEREQSKKDEYLNSKTIIVETAESQLEEARQINAETEQYRNDIDQIKKDVKAEIEKDYTEKYQQLYDVQEYQKQQTEQLEKQKQEQNQKTEELSKREEKLLNLEAEKKVVEEKEKEILERENQIKFDADVNLNKETSLKAREDELNTAIQNFNEQYKTADEYFKQQQQNFEENEKNLIEFRKEYREKATIINEWDEAFNFIKEAEPDTWVDNEFEKTFQKKQDTQTLIQRIKQGLKGFIAKIKHMYDKKISNYEKKLNGFDFTDEKGESMHSFGSAEIQTMFISEANAKTFRQIADDMDAEGVNNYSELHKRKPKYLERHFKYARERVRDNERHR